jgi:methanogenic corrinoid protein MtbC1/CRP-like cAMP-binding protein
MAVCKAPGKERRSEGSSLLDIVEANGIGRLEHYDKGQMLYWQGDPVECAFVVRRGKIETFSICPEGQVHTYNILGPGALLEGIPLSSEEEHRNMARALEEVDIYVIQQHEFQHLLSSKPSFSTAVVRELTQIVDLLARDVRALSLLDVHERLEHSLRELAKRCGTVSDRGLEIELDVTHEQLANLVVAHRTTVTCHLCRLEHEGLLKREGRRLILTLPQHADTLKNLRRAVVECDADAAARWAKEALEAKVDPARALDALTAGMNQVDRDLAEGKLAWIDIVGAAFAVKSAQSVIQEEMERVGQRTKTNGTVVIGTVCGDIHDLGKNIVSLLLTAEGFTVHDIGASIPPERFVEAVKEYEPDILAISALMPSTISQQRKVIDLLKTEGLRRNVKIMVGGGAMTEELAESIGADGYAPTAHGAPGLARRLIQQT